MEQRQEAGARVAQIKIPTKMDNSLLDKHKHNDYDTDVL